METRVGLWARLTKDKRSIYVASFDWEMILMRPGNKFFRANKDRWSEEEGTIRSTAKEAAALADALVAAGGRQCGGTLMIDSSMAGGAVRGTRMETVEDGLTPEQRTAQLIQFLREGAFKWRFITGPIHVTTGGSAG